MLCITPYVSHTICHTVYRFASPFFDRIAAWNGDLAMMRLLVEGGADIAARDR
jgi:predicted LPLAT superfamily acyltransferase